MGESFSEKIQSEKQARIVNLANDTSLWADKEAISKYFENNKVSPETIANFLKMVGKNGDYIEWQFPQITLSEKSKNLLSEIEARWPFSSPENLLEEIAKYLKEHMSYDLLTLLFSEARDDDGFVKEIRKALGNPNAKFSLSRAQQNSLQTFVINLQMNWRYSPSEEAILREFSINLYNPKWIEEKLSADGRFRALLTKIAQRNSAQLFSSEKAGILRQNENISRETVEIVNNVRVWICRDFAMLTKKIYTEIAAKNFPNSEAIYVGNKDLQHAYIILASENPDGSIKKEYFDPTAYITWGNLRAPLYKLLPKWSEVWASKNEESTRV